MYRIAMRLALLIGVIGMSATEARVPQWDTVPSAEASIPQRACKAPAGSVGHTRSAARELAVAVPERRVIRREAFAIPADRPRPPLGRFKLTAYSGPQLGQALPITATGTSARAGRTVAVDPRVIPLGSRIYIEGVGERIAEDVGGGVKGNHIDVYLPSVPQARRFGVRRGVVSMITSPGAAG